MKFLFRTLLLACLLCISLGADARKHPQAPHGKTKPQTVVHSKKKGHAEKAAPVRKKGKGKQEVSTRQKGKGHKAGALPYAERNQQVKQALAARSREHTGNSAETHGLSREQLENQRMSLLAEIKQTTEALDELRKDKKASLAALQALQAKLTARQNLIANINHEINLIEHRINLANHDVNTLKSQLDTLKKQYAEMVRYTYKNRTSADLIVFLFSSTSFNDAARRLQYVKQYRSYRAEQAARIVSAGKQLNNKLTVLNMQKQQKDFVLIAQENQRNILEAETQEKNKVVNELKGKEKDMTIDLARKRKAADDLNRAISNAIRREIELARKRAQEEKLQQERLRKQQEEQERKLANQKGGGKTAEDKQLAEKEKQALAERYRREEAERQLALERKDRESREQALAVERKKQEEAEKQLNQLSKNKRAEKEKELAAARKKQDDEQKKLNAEKLKQDERQKQLAAEKQRQEEYQRQLADDRRKREGKGSGQLASNTETKSNVKTFERDDYKFGLTPAEQALSSNFAANRGKLPWPVEKGYIAEHFGKNKHPLFNVVTENYGVDIRTSIGATARAVYAGEVNSIINVPGMGQTVLINHGSFFTVYSKLSKVQAGIVKGAHVSTKQAIGTVSTDDDGNTLIHFEVWKVASDGSPYKENPETWVAQ